MTLRKIIYPITLVIALSYGCVQNEHQRFQNLSREEKYKICVESMNEMYRNARKEGWEPRKAFPNMNFSCEIYGKKKDDD